MKNVPFTIFLFATLFHFLPLLTNAQHSGKFDLGADMVTRYVWRGSDFSNSPNIQPWANYSVGGFKAEAWTSFSITENYQEVDWIFSYEIKETFKVILTDYFFPNGTNFNNQYFDFSKDNTEHILEASLEFGGTSKFPINASVNYNFYGADPDNSWYFELGYSGAMKEVDYDLFIGATPGKGIYLPDGSDNFSPVNIGFTLAKEIKMSEHFSLPVFGSLVLNPQAENIFFVFGISL
jgi:hypothetical protein